MASYIELDKNLTFPSASNEGRVVLGVNTSGSIIVTDVAGSTISIGSVTITTVSEIQSMAASGSLLQGAFYLITDADTDGGGVDDLYGLYGGNEIIVQAVANNAISAGGVGKFYTPKYNKNTDGYGIWSNYTTIYTYNNVGDFIKEENITGNGGQTATVVGAVPNGGTVFLTDTVGNWATVNTITGDDSNATALNDGSTVPSYASGSTVIWGGRLWSNLTGEVGSSDNEYNLDNTNWAPIPFNDVDYNVTWDIIEYDLTNDFIQMRQDKASNVVKQSYVNWWDNEGPRAIKAFQWGNEWVPNVNGLANNIVIDSTFECINFKGWRIHDNSITQDSYIGNNVFEQESYFRRNTFINVGMSDNFLGGNGAEIDNNVMNDVGVYGNLFVANSYINANNMQDAWFSYNTTTNSGFYDNALHGAQMYYNYTANGYDGIGSNNLYYSNLDNNTLNRSYIEGNQLKTNCYLTNNTLNRSQISGNILESDSNVEYNTVSHNSRIDNNTIANSGYLGSNILTSGSYIEVNTVKNDSSLNSNTLDSDSTIYSNTISDESSVYNLYVYSSSYVEANQVVGTSNIYSITLDPASSPGNAYIYANTVQNQSYIAQSDLGQASISYNSINNISGITNIIAATDAFIEKNSLTSNSTIANITMTAGSNQVNYNSINNSSILGNFGSQMAVGETNEYNALFNQASMTNADINNQFYANL